MSAIKHRVNFTFTFTFEDNTLDRDSVPRVVSFVCGLRDSLLFCPEADYHTGCQTVLLDYANEGPLSRTILQRAKHNFTEIKIKQRQ
jgi:hypothetical protein